jgi:hypothetical protein
MPVGSAIAYGRDAEIRTRGLVVPNDARYQAALHPVVYSVV